jgi:hypothetical protein
MKPPYRLTRRTVYHRPGDPPRPTPWARDQDPQGSGKPGRWLPQGPVSGVCRPHNPKHHDGTGTGPGTGYLQMVKRWWDRPCTDAGACSDNGSGWVSRPGYRAAVGRWPVGDAPFVRSWRLGAVVQVALWYSWISPPNTSIRSTGEAAAHGATALTVRTGVGGCRSRLRCGRRCRSGSGTR